jgi:hypothetical protein
MTVAKEELMARLKQGLDDMALGDVKRASRPGESETGGAKMAGFLLGFCLIDAAAGFHSGRTKEMQAVIGKHFRTFVTTYMPRYDADALYHDLRSGLVHSYSVGQTYSFTDLERAGKHLETRQFSFGERILLNLEDFVDDLERALDALFEDIQTKPERFELAKTRYESMGILGVGS